MDRHELPGLTAMEVAEGHKQDLKIQHEFDCRALTYWFDEARGTAFCLIEAPNKKAVRDLHDTAHGLIPNQIVEVDTNLVEAFLGRIEDPGVGNRTDDSPPLSLVDPAFRIIMVIEFNGMVLMKSEYGITSALELLSKKRKLVEKILEKHDGRVVTNLENGFIASFSSASESYECAIELQKSFLISPGSPSPVHTSIGLSAGEPITGKSGLFGESIQLAKRLCYIAGKGQVIISSTVRDQYRRAGVDFKARDNSFTLLQPEEETFLTRLMDITDKIWNRERLNVSFFAKQVGLSKSQLYRNITSLTGYSPTEFIKEIRLKRATKMIERQQGNISQIAYETGFSTPSYFSKCFKKRFGFLPSEYQNAVT